MKKIISLLVFSIIVLSNNWAQITNGPDTLYGNEWINFDQSYFKIMVVEDGMHKITHQQLTNAGVPTDQIEGSQYQLFYNGEEIPIYTTSNTVFNNNDHIEFYGKKNRSQLDQYLFEDPENEMLNPYYSLFTDTSAYFLTWTDVGTPLRYEETENDLTNVPAKEEYYIEKLVKEYHNEWVQEGYNYAYSSSFNKAEGYCGGLANLQKLTIEPAHPFSAGQQASLLVRYSTNNTKHFHQISLNGDVWHTDADTFYLIGLQYFEKPINNNLLENPIDVRFQGLASNNDRIRVSNIILKYPREFNALNNSSFLFDLEPDNNKKYIEVSGFNNSGNQVYLFDLKNKKRILTKEENDLIKVAIPVFNENSSFNIISENGFKSPVSIHPVSFIDYADQSSEYIILSNNRLFNDGQGNNRVAEYAAYRESMEGGEFSTLIIDVQQLYDQFGWGINRHAISIRNFGLYINKNWDTPAEYLFILGKGRNYNATRTKGQLNSANNASFYVPTFGVPGSDVLLMCNKGSIAPNVAIGRLPVEIPDEIAVYLNKIKEHDKLHTAPSTIADRAWMKRVLHLGGGGNAGEQGLIRNYLEGMGDILKDSEFGGEVRGFYKNSTDPVQISTNESIFNLINGGVKILTFFGHSGVNQFDFNIDNPNNYKNKGRYPIMFSLGCYIGGIHTSTKGISERFVLLPDGAAIGFVASTGAGYISSLNTVTKKAYSLIGNEMYGASIGNILKATNQHLESTGFGDRFLATQITFNGDPAIRTNVFEGPDYTIDYSTIKIKPNIVNITADSFALEFDILNIGKANPNGDSINFIIKQELPNNSLLTLKERKIVAPLNRKKIAINLPTSGEPSLGLNKIHIELDIDNRVDELPSPFAETNNELTSFLGEKGFPFYVQNNGAAAVYPYEFAIVGDQDLTLHASTYDPLVETQKYIFQMDTIETFDSPFLIKYEMEQSGGLLKWKPNITLEEEEVYYWRVSPDSISPVAGYNWSGSSFVYLEGKEGWNQSDYGQYLKNEYDGLTLDNDKRNKRFGAVLKDVRINNKIPSPQFFSNGSIINSPWPWLTNEGIQLIVFDPNYFSNWYNPAAGGEYGTVPVNYAVDPWVYKTSTIEDRENLMNFIENVIPDDWYVILYSVQKNINSDYIPEEWANDSLTLGKNIFSVIENQGATRIRELEQKGAVPYIFVFQKNEGKLNEAIADDINGIATIENAFPQNFTSGLENSTVIGSVKSWNKIEWENIGNENDTVHLSVHGLNPVFGIDSILIFNGEEMEIDISQISADEFPYLKLMFYAKDEIERTASNLANWRVYYEGIPEFAVNPSGEYVLNKDTLQQGEEFNLAYEIENLSKIPGDSLLIKYRLLDKENNEIQKYKKVEGLEGEKKSITGISFETMDFNGLQSIGVEINPNDDQSELSHVNNFLFDKFYIENDKRNPLLEVTFDGLHILNGDLVSPTPLISISLEDENQFLLLSDTAHINLFIKKPATDIPAPIFYNNKNVLFSPANEVGANKAKIEYRPDFEVDGTYQLLVQGADVTGNASGELDYKVNFEVINTNAISSLINYPNPFSTSTRFVYTLTGRELPTDYKIQIMAVSGRIVKEIDELELGPLKTGTNMTDYAWDGKDQYGDQLANGVYLYRFIINEDEKIDRKRLEIEKVDKYFKGGLGKMVLIR